MSAKAGSFITWLSKLRWSLLLIAGLIVAAVTHHLPTVLIVLGVIAMVMVHEFGHFITAKLSGMKVTEYFLGFGPRLWSFRRGETEYGVKGLPAGGYVRIIGMNNLEEVEEQDESRTYRQHPFYQRIIVVCAGSFMHFVMAFLLLFSVFVFVGQVTATNSVGSISKVQDSPAAAAGVQVGDRILSVNGVPVDKWDDVISHLAQAAIGVPNSLEVLRNGQPMTLQVTPIDRRNVKLADGTPLPDVDQTKAAAFIGVSPRAVYKTEAPWTAASSTASHMWHDSGQVVTSIGKIFSPSGLKTYYQNVTGTVPAQKQAEAQETRFLSPVGLVGYADDAASAGWAASLTLLYAINLFVGIFNMTPLLPFDGGHVAIALYEKVRSIGRRTYYAADFNKMLPVSYAVLLVLLVISLSSLWLDIVNPAPNPFE